MYKALILVAFSAILSGCASVGSDPRAADDGMFRPLIDEKATGADKMASYKENKDECFALADKRFGDENNGFLLGLKLMSGDKSWKTNYQDTVRRCLVGRGYFVVN